MLPVTPGRGAGPGLQQIETPVLPLRLAHRGAHPLREQHPEEHQPDQVAAPPQDPAGQVLVFFAVLFTQWVRSSMREAVREDRRLNLMESRAAAVPPRATGTDGDRDDG